MPNLQAGHDKARQEAWHLIPSAPAQVFGKLTWACLGLGSICVKSNDVLM